MQNKKLLLLIVLSIASVFSLFYGIFTPSRTKRNILTKNSGIQKVKTIMTEKGIISLTRRAKRSNYSSWGRNPFAISGTPIRRFEGLILNGILWDNKSPMAIVNEKIVKIGDKIDGNVVVDIEQDRVILNDGSKNIELLLGR